MISASKSVGTPRTIVGLVFANSLLAITSGLIPFAHSTTILKPFLLLSFLILVISVISFSAISPISVIKDSVEVP